MNEAAALFIAPPYVARVSRLYYKAYTGEDHRELSFFLESLHSNCPGTDIQLHYNDDELVRGIYTLPEVVGISRRYCA